MSQNVKECTCLIYVMLRNTEAETMECYKNHLQTDLGTTFCYIPRLRCENRCTA